MEGLLKGVVISVAVVAAAVAVALEWWQARNVPEPYTTHGQRRARD